MTKTQLKVLRFLSKGSATGLEVARHLWPNSKGWERQVKSALGVRNNNAGMSRPAKGILTRLMKASLVDIDRGPVSQCDRFSIRFGGREILAEEAKNASRRISGKVHRS